MDFIDRLPMSNRKEKLLIVVDRLTEYAHFVGINRTYSTKQFAEIFYKNVYKLHGFPIIIVSVRDAKFKSNV
jgi:hypothetical protein